MYTQSDIVSIIKASRARWLGHVARTKEQGVPKRMMDCNLVDQNEDEQN